MATVWQRPKSLEFPRLWKTFKGLTEIDGKIPEFRIGDIPEETFDTVINIMVSAIDEKENSITETQNFWRKALQQRLSLVCVLETIPTGTEIVSISINYRAIPSDPEITYLGDKFGSSWLIRQLALQRNNIYEQFNVGEVITGVGGFTDLKYQSHNIYIEMLKCRDLLGKAIGIKMTLVMTTPEWQEELKREGFKDYGTVTYEELNKISKTPDIPDGQCFKLMYNCYE